MSRQKILLGVFGLGVIGVGLAFFFTDMGDNWRELVSGPRSRTALRAPGARRATTATAPATFRSGSVRPPTLVRELPRQALIIAALHGTGTALRDDSVDFTPSSGDAAPSCVTDYDFAPHIARITVRDRAGSELATSEVTVPMLEQNYPDYAKYAAVVEPLCETKFAGAIAKAGVAASTPVKSAAADMEAPAEVEGLLAKVDAYHSFVAARVVHAAIAETGESPQRLAALVRAYSNLGESTRYLYSPAKSAFFARAMIYGERAVRRYPNEPVVHAARGYAYTLLGQPLEGRAAVAKARELAKGEKLAEWVELVDELSRFRTGALIQRGMSSRDPTLASYFLLLSVEHTGLPAIVNTSARLVLKQNPGALRAINIMNDNSGVSLQHETTVLATQAQLQLLAALATDATTPEKLKTATAEAMQRKFEAPALLELLARMDTEPTVAGQLLPWSVYSSIVRDALFVNAFRQLYFAQHMLSVDTTELFATWWPIVKDHRFASVFAGFDRSGRVGDRQARDRIRQLSATDFRDRMVGMFDHPLKPRAGSTLPSTWKESYAFESDETAYDLAHSLWAWHEKEADEIQILAAIKSEIGNSLSLICPDHPSAVAEMLVNRWPVMRDKAAQIEKEMGTHPQVAYALGRAYRNDGRLADAARLLEQVASVCPDPAVYKELAELYKQQGDADKWLAIYDKYLAKSEDFGLDHARANENVAYTLMRMKRADRALAYAQAAGESGAGWAMMCHAACLTALHRYAEAEQVVHDSQERYEDMFCWYRWCQETGHGDLKAARELSAAQVKEIEASPAEANTNDAAIYLYLDGKPDRARVLWEEDWKQNSRDLYDGLQLALLDLEQGKDEAARQHLDGSHVSSGAMGLPPELAKMMGAKVTKADTTRHDIYQAAADEVQRCLDEPGAIPARDSAALKVILDGKDTAYRGCAAYFLGRLCELRGKKDEARWWYRTSLETGEWTFSCRPQAGAGLRRLGEEYYK